MPERVKKLLLVGASLLVLTGAVAAIVWSLTPAPPPSGPVPIVWDKTACAQCRMHIGEPPFAAQLQTSDGRVLDFDDPGCLFELIAAQQPGIAQIYFHHSEQERWLSREEVGFVLRTPTPMGYGLAAVERTRPGALDFEQAGEHVRSKRQAKHGDAP
jgi:hypothetical protein